jgi:hypothetical protein
VHRSTRNPIPRTLAVAIAALWTGCAAPQPPPAPAPVPVAVVDLARVGRIGVLHFTAAGETALEPAARAAFLAALAAFQPGAELVELGPAGKVLGANPSRIDAAAIRAIGRATGVDAVLVAELQADPIDPLGFMQRARSTPGAVEIEGSLHARLFETEGGTRIWSTRALGSKPVTPVRVDAWGSKTVDTRHLEQVQAALVQDLVAQATADFEPHLPIPVAER